jgi:hypothetical protein
MLPDGGVDVRDEFGGQGGHQSGPQGQYCPTCGRFEPDVWARFCGACGGTLDAPGSSGTEPGAGSTSGRAPAMPTPQVPPTPHYAPSYPAAAATYGIADPRMVYRIPSVGIWGAARIGAAVVAAFSLIPCLAIGFVTAWLVHQTRVLLDSWQSAALRVPAIVTNVDVRLNFIDLLQLRSLLDVATYWDDRLWMTFAIAWLVPWFVVIVGGVLFAVLLAVVYNIVGGMGGGLRVSVTPDGVAAPQAWSSQPPSAPWPVEGPR